MLLGRFLPPSVTAVCFCSLPSASRLRPCVGIASQSPSDLCHVYIDVAVCVCSESIVIVWKDLRDAVLFQGLSASVAAAIHLVEQCETRQRSAKKVGWRQEPLSRFMPFNKMAHQLTRCYTLLQAMHLLTFVKGLLFYVVFRVKASFFVNTKRSFTLPYPCTACVRTGTNTKKWW